MLYERLLRPALFRLGDGDAEVAHTRTLAALAALGHAPAVVAAARRASGAHAPGLARTVFGVRFPGPVGLAAGMDKDGVALRAWGALGLGFVEVGTVTRHPQPGNPRPRLVRLPAVEGVVNRMGFNNAGAAALAARLDALAAARRRGGPREGEGVGAPRGSGQDAGAPRRSGAGRWLGLPLGISLGKSKVTPVDEALADYVASLRLLHAHADYVAVNVSSPNTPGLRSLQDRGALDALLSGLRAEARALAEAGPAVPLLVKIAPDLSDAAIGEVLQACDAHGVAGVIAVNTTLARTGLSGQEVARAGPGGLSGRPLSGRARQVVRFVAAESGGRLPVIGVGGVLDPDDAARLLDAGAALVQLYTGLVYRGPGLIRRINRTQSRRATPPARIPSEAP